MTLTLTQVGDGNGCVQVVRRRCLRERKDCRRFTRMILLTFQLVICRAAINTASFPSLFRPYRSRIVPSPKPPHLIRPFSRNERKENVRKTISKETNSTDGTHYGPLLRTSSTRFPYDLSARRSGVNRIREINPLVLFSKA